MSNNHLRIKLIEEKLRQAFKPSLLKVSDESHLHHGHEGAKSGKGHFAIEIVSPVFSHKTTLEQHRLIYHVLGDLMETDIHALRIKSQIS